jgi:two-component system, chemotaxis family, protein-glutamate methylesterase/glutaminase
LNSLLEAQDDAMERALWTAVRTLEESASLSRKLQQQALGRGHTTSAAYFGNRAESAERDSSQVRRALESQVRAAVASDQK